MFDDNNFSNSAPPQNLPVDEPKDMFGDVDEEKKEEPPNALRAGMLKKKEEVNYGDFKEEEEIEKVQVVKEPVLGKIILIVLIGVLLAGIAIGGFWLYDNFLINKDKVIIIDETNEDMIVEVEKQEEIIPDEIIVTTTSEDAITDMIIDEVLFGEPVDSDKDGLDDVREIELGTDPLNPDTDGDGLIDGDEVIIWKTDPLNPDTDGDGYLDGLEVKSGYNPLGTGKLFSEEKNNSLTTNTSVTNTKE